MIIVLGLVILVLGIIVYVVCKKANSRDGKGKTRGEYDGLAGWSMFASVVSAVFLVILGFVALGLAGDTADLQTFYDGNISLYQANITDTRALLTDTQETPTAAIPVQGSIEKVGIGTLTADRLKELRDATTQYNNKLAFYHIVKNNIWISVLYPDIPANIKYIYVR